MNIRLMRRTTSVRVGARSRALAILAVLGVLVSGTIVGASASPAYATDYPSWHDVAAARTNEANAKGQIAQIQSLLAGLKADAERTAADSDAKGIVYREADQKFQEAAARASQLQGQADAAQSKADSSKQRAGQMYAQLARTNSSDVTAHLLVNAKQADGLLYGLGMASKISAQAQAIYDQAIQDSNTAQSLTDLANQQKKILETLKVAAEKALAEAQTAATAAATAFTAQQTHAAILQQQLIVLTQNREATEADFLAGIIARTGSGANLAAGEISLSGYALPASGRITDSFGYRIHPVYGGWRFHSGTDIGASCGDNIYAAHSGTVVYAGRNGTYGNWILIDDGDGISTGYAHIVDGGILVDVGQSVEVGTNIAHVGTTGASTGCHLHFEVRENGVAVDAVPFMAGQGITIG